MIQSPFSGFVAIGLECTESPTPESQLLKKIMYNVPFLRVRTEAIGVADSLQLQNCEFCANC